MPYLDETECPGVSQVELTTWDDAVKFSKDPDSFILGYPPVRRLCDVLCAKYGKENESCVCFPSYTVAKRCREYIKSKCGIKVRILQLATSKPKDESERDWKIESRIAVVFVNSRYFPMARDYLLLCGEAISNRLAWYVLRELFMIERNIRETGLEEEEDSEDAFIEARFGRNLNPELGFSSGFKYIDQAKRLVKRRLARIVLDANHSEEEEGEEGGATNLPSDPLSQWRLNFAADEEEDIRNINTTGSVVPGEPINAVPSELNDGGDDIEPSTEEERGSGTQQEGNSRTSEVNPNSLSLNNSKDIYLHASGTAALYTALRILLQYDQHRVNRSRSNNSSSSSLNIASQNTPIYKRNVILGNGKPNNTRMLEEFSAVHLLPDDNTQAMQHLKRILQSGEQLLGVFVEVPSEPYWQCSNIPEIKRLSELYRFFVVIYTSINDAVNLDLLEYADMIAISLGLYGGGSLVLNPRSGVYKVACDFMNAGVENYEENLWAGDHLLLERASRGLVKRNKMVNSTAEYLINKVLLPQEGKLFKKVYYPGISTACERRNVDDSNANYETIRCKSCGGYGGRICLTFKKPDEARLFYDTLDISKCPGGKFDTTTAIPYTVVGYNFMTNANNRGEMDPTLIQLNIGLEDKADLRSALESVIERTLGARSGIEGNKAEEALGR